LLLFLKLNLLLPKFSSLWLAGESHPRPACGFFCSAEVSGAVVNAVDFSAEVSGAAAGGVDFPAEVSGVGIYGVGSPNEVPEWVFTA